MAYEEVGCFIVILLVCDLHPVGNSIVSRRQDYIGFFIDRRWQTAVFP